MKLINSIKNLTKDSGIYQYFDESDRILYIGKAKNLKKRVSSYFNISDDIIKPSSKLSPRISNMVQKIKYIKTIIVNSEQDALILENSLIKQLKPKYNILLRDDKTYPYILIDKNSSFPRLEVVRKIVNNKDFLYFGPYANGIKDIIDSIYELLPLVQKKNCLKEKKSCLFYQINRCLAPCENKITKDEYKIITNKAIDLLKNPKKITDLLQEKMLMLASELRFEEANTLKFRIKKINQISNISSIDLAKLYNFDIFAIYSKSKKSVVIKMFMRDGKITSSDYYFINHNDNDIDLNYLYSQALINHYKQNIAINLDSILLPIELETKDEILSFIQSNKKITISNPKTGDKKNLINLALNNAKNILENNNDDDKLLESIKKILKLENIPNRIEVFDTSHHSATSIVGSMIVYQDGGFIKNNYRKYILEGKDEYLQMKELLTRRAKDFYFNPPPDLWLIDGGIGQINIASEILKSSGTNIDIIAIAKEKVDSKAYRAKGGARDILRGLDIELRLEKNDERLLFLQKLRDEAHRYAITFHRQKKEKNLLKSDYTPAQIKKLLNYFASFENINNASNEEIKKVLKNKKNS